jgi:hypothetical protein
MKSKAFLRKMAERGGFEPPIRFYSYNGLANRRFRPLSHLSQRCGRINRESFGKQVNVPPSVADVGRKISIEFASKRAHLLAGTTIMSRNLVILLVVLSAGIAGLITFSKLRSKDDASPSPAAANTRPAVPESPSFTAAPPSVPRHAVDATTGVRTVAVPGPAGNHQGRTTTAIRSTTPLIVAITNTVGDVTFETKPLPVLEKDYTATTNRDARLDIMMDIAENSSAETVKTLTRLFEAETDPDLKIDLLDSLLGIEGFPDEKLIMLTMGSRQGLASEIRQSAIDGLIDLDDRRVIPVLNGLLNDPDEEIREGARDALEMLQAQPVK